MFCVGNGHGRFLIAVSLLILLRLDIAFDIGIGRTMFLRVGCIGFGWT